MAGCELTLSGRSALRNFRRGQFSNESSASSHLGGFALDEMSWALAWAHQSKLDERNPTPALSLIGTEQNPRHLIGVRRDSEVNIARSETRANSMNWRAIKPGRQIKLALNCPCT